MDIRGFVKFSLIDYPGKIACVIFAGKCNFRCPFCHNPHLVLAPHTQLRVFSQTIIDFLKSRRGRLDAVVISGGEPTLQAKLPDFARTIKSLDYKIKLDTNGSNPEVVEHLYNEGLIDYIGIDWKAPRHKYASIAGKYAPENVAEKIQKTISFAVHKNMHMDIRTTVHKALLSEDDINKMKKELREIGVKEWTLQQFHHADLIDDSLKEKKTYEDHELSEIAKELGENTKVRGIKIHVSK